MKGIRFVYGVLLAVWAMIVIWQIADHYRVRESARAALINRSKDISSTLGLVLRSQRPFGGVISRERLESALNSLVKPGDLNAVALLSDAGEVVASAGAPIDFEHKTLVPTGEYWADRTVTLMNLVDLETNVTAEVENRNPTIVLPRSNLFNSFATNRPPPPPPDRGPPEQMSGINSNSLSISNAQAPRRNWFRRRDGDDRRPPFGRPHWMNEEDYRALIQKQGVHSFVVVLSTQSMQTVTSRDFWLRLLISALASVSVVGLGMAWHNLAKTSELEVRLVRAAELNTRLKEMNLAAAGLAHETRNPLNIIRGLAQMISRHEEIPQQIRAKSREIVDETDRVTAQLNEFINYSRPREVRRATVALNAVVGEVARALGNDLEEKAAKLDIQESLPAIVADEQLLRQALFNLVMNAIQAVPSQGEIQIRAGRTGVNGVYLEIRDNGLGVPPEQRQEIFKPYFTTHQKGTGLGLAVVQQIVLAHGWEIECLPNDPQGAVFRLTHLQPASPA
ncbi:MAG TPA: ATP-binding protein [Candidatus Paceibacterota bacterium]|nr:ATP-binding protein [Candidatus Paceibacterota bacterium]HSA02301.1 ATP-binding protein [Candidatus Paceibacterota bacterium]